jgi:hypothetical protein
MQFWGIILSMTTNRMIPGKRTNGLYGSLTPIPRLSLDMTKGAAFINDNLI